MKALYELKEMLCRELDELAGKGEMSVGDLDLVHKLTDTVKNIDKIMMLEEDGGYSRAGGWEARGTYGRYNDGGSSYAHRGKHYVRAHYSRDDGYSRHCESLLEELEGLRDNANTQTERDMIQRLIDEMKNR